MLAWLENRGDVRNCSVMTKTSKVKKQKKKVTTKARVTASALKPEVAAVAKADGISLDDATHKLLKLGLSRWNALRGYAQRKSGSASEPELALDPPVADTAPL